MSAGQGGAGSAAGALGVVLAGGSVRVTDELRRAVGGAVVVIAADAGVRHAGAFGRRPDLIVGDFDSATEGELEPYQDVARVTHPREKDQLDLELGIEAALERGARRLLLLGTLGGRVDQTLAALLIAGRLRGEGVHARLVSRRHEAWILAAGDDLEPDLPEGTLFSLLSLQGDARVDVGGARYPLSGAALPFGVGLGVSNEARGRTSVRVRRGLVALIVEWGEP